MVGRKRRVRLLTRGVGERFSAFAVRGEDEGGYGG